MVAAQVEGMGRVALSRSLLFSQLGPDSAREAIAAAALLPSTPPALVFGIGSHGEGSSSSTQAFDAFGHVKTVATSFSLKPRRSGGKIGSHVIDERLGRVRSWLESDDEEEEELEEKRQLTWSTAPREWEQEIAEEERRRLVESRLEPELEIAYVEEEETEEAPPVLHQQVRVGGKNIRILLTTKRKRVEEDGEGGGERAEGETGSEAAVGEEDMEEAEEAPVEAPPVRSAPKTRAALAMQLDRQESRRPNGKGRAVEDIVDCICHQPDDEEQPMIQCDECQVWLHLACLQIPSSKRLPQQWSCFRCTDSDQPELPSAKRVRIQDDEPLETIAGSPSTPTFPHQEPILVASSSSPRPRNNFYRGYAPDMALAPSPKSSPIRRHAAIPRSPVANHVLPIPVTPKLTHDNRADYSPRSPLFYRTGRVRMVSGGGFEDPHAVGLQGAWVGGWDGHVFGNSHGYKEHYPMDTDDDFQPKSWHDMTMTPSRTVASSFEWETPGRARAGPSTTATPRTASQTFLSALHNENDSHEGGHQRAPSFAQRLFGSPTHHPRVVPSSTSAPYYPPPSSPLHPKGARVARQRVPSVPFSFQQPFASASSTSALASNPFAAAVGSIARRGSLEYAASASPYRAQQQGPTMARSGSGSLEHAVALDGK